MQKILKFSSSCSSSHFEWSSRWIQNCQLNYVLLIPCKIHTRIIAWQTSASVRCIWSSLQVLILICESSQKVLFSDILLPTDSGSISCGFGQPGRDFCLLHESSLQDGTDPTAGSSASNNVLIFHSSGTHSTRKFKVYDDDDDDDEHENQFCNQELFCKIDSACTEWLPWIPDDSMKNVSARSQFTHCSLPYGTWRSGLSCHCCCGLHQTLTKNFWISTIPDACQNLSACTASITSSFIASNNKFLQQNKILKTSIEVWKCFPPQTFMGFWNWGKKL